MTKQTTTMTAPSDVPAAADLMVWVDLETFGLNSKDDPITELGIVLTTFDLDVVMDYSCVVWDEERAERYKARYEGDIFVLDMHDESGLWHDALEYPNMVSTPAEAYGRAIDFLSDYGITPKTQHPMCGSSVHFDRSMLAEQAPQLHQVFGHRNIDISSIKELCRRINPRMYDFLDQDVKPKKKHRVLPDIEDTLGEAEWYFDNFLHHTLPAVRPQDNYWKKVVER